MGQGGASSTGGGGVDHVVEVGGAGTLAQSLRAIRVGGKITMIGVLSGAAEINPMLILPRRANLQGISVGSHADVRGHEPRHRGGRAQAGHRQGLCVRRGAGRYRHLQSAQHFGKVVIRVA